MVSGGVNYHGRLEMTVKELASTHEVTERYIRAEAKKANEAKALYV